MPEKVITLTSATDPQLRLQYDSTHYTDFETGSDGSLTVTPTGTSGAVMPVKFAQQDGIVLQFPTGEANRAFNMTMKSFANPFDGTRDDWVMRWGYNIAAGGGRTNLLEHAFALEMEDYWTQSATQNWTEFHLAYTSKTTGTVYRPFSYLIDVDDDTCIVRHQATQHSFESFDGLTNWLTIGDSSILVYRALSVQDNNTSALLQENAAGTGAISLIYANAADEVVLGTDTSPTRVVTELRIGEGAATPLAKVKINGSVDAGFYEAIDLLQNANSAGSYTGIRFAIGNTHHGRLGYDGTRFAWFFDPGTGTYAQAADLGADYMRLLVPLALNTTQITGATAGSMVMPQGKFVRSVNAAGNNTIKLLGTDGADRTQINANTQLLRFEDVLTTSTATNGAATLPSPGPVGFLRVLLSGTEYRIPYYGS